MSRKKTIPKSACIACCYCDRGYSKKFPMLSRTHKLAPFARARYAFPPAAQSIEALGSMKEVKIRNFSAASN